MAARTSMVGIEALNVFGGSAVLDVELLASHRGLDRARFENLLMKQKAVALPYEDPVSFAVNAAWPIVNALPTAEKDRIELLITCTESGIDFGKSLSTYVHHHLQLSRNCRMFEIKQACYSGTAGFQMAVNFVLANTSPGAKALVIATDISRFIVADGGDALTEDWSFAEPSGGAGAVAMLVSASPRVFQLDIGASGYYGYEVMDTCRPVPDSEAGNADLSLLSYLDCCEATYKEYRARVAGADYRSTFNQLVFHTPFGGMVKGAHRTMMRKLLRAEAPDIEADFERRVQPGLRYCQRVGNIMGGTVFLALASSIDHAECQSPLRIGCFSYGSGCCAEFYSGVVTPEGQAQVRGLHIGAQLESRYPLSIEEYEWLLQARNSVRFGARNLLLDREFAAHARSAQPGGKRLYLREIREFHREYDWVQ
jgi:3-carboxymethyl-3-hydroxy-acyl-[acp] synthase